MSRHCKGNVEIRLAKCMTALALQVCVSISNGLMTFVQCELRKSRILPVLSTLAAAVYEATYLYLLYKAREEARL
jgi:hypothetical protein